MAQRPIVLLLIPHLGGGGAERITSLLAAGLSAAKYDVHLGLVTQANSGPETLPPHIQVHPLGARRVRAGAFRLLRLIRRLKPDVILSGMAHLNFMVLMLRSLLPRNLRVLVRQNGAVAHPIRRRPAAFTRLLYRQLYPRAELIVCQTPAMAAELAALVKLPYKLRVLPNPVDIEAIRAFTHQGPVRFAGPGPHLLAVGRLAPEKGFDLLLEAFRSVLARFPTANLTLLGAGPEEEALKSLCSRLGLDSAVRFAGHVPRPAAWFPGATLFVLPSRHEGMPNALLEAAAGGLPIVALPAQGGVAALLRDQPGVWVAQSVSADALAICLHAALLAIPPAKRYAHHWVNEFRLDRAIHLYEDLIDSVCAQ